MEEVTGGSEGLTTWKVHKFTLDQSYKNNNFKGMRWAGNLP